jgi:hypothetical protein
MCWSRIWLVSTSTTSALRSRSPANREVDVEALGPARLVLDYRRNVRGTGALRGALGPPCPQSSVSHWGALRPLGDPQTHSKSRGSAREDRVHQLGVAEGAAPQYLDSRRIWRVGDHARLGPVREAGLDVCKQRICYFGNSRTFCAIVRRGYFISTY